jgi:hypothetical protein
MTDPQPHPVDAAMDYVSGGGCPECRQPRNDMLHLRCDDCDDWGDGLHYHQWVLCDDCGTRWEAGINLSSLVEMFERDDPDYFAWARDEASTYRPVECFIPEWALNVMNPRGTPSP